MNGTFFADAGNALFRPGDKKMGKMVLFPYFLSCFFHCLVIIGNFSAHAVRQFLQIRRNAKGAVILGPVGPLGVHQHRYLICPGKSNHLL